MMQPFEPMQGVQITYDHNGRPAVLTFDLQNLDPIIKPLVDELLAFIQQAEEGVERTPTE
jgi:hypothetical protein